MRTESFFNYIQYEKRFSAFTIKSYKTDLHQFSEYLSETYNITTASQVNYQHIRSWMVYLVNKELTPRSIHRKLSALKTYFRFLVRKGEVEKNPATKVTAPKRGTKLPSIIENDKIELLLGDHYFGNNFPDLRDKLIIELLYETGIRLSELIELTQKSFNFYNQTFRVEGKGNKQRILPFSNKTQKSIQKYLLVKKEYFEGEKIDDFLLVSNKGNKMYPKLVHRILNKYLGLITTSTKRNPHTLRHTFATQLLNNGSDLNAIKELLGHTSLAATQVYTHNSIEKIKNIYQKAHPKSE